jgi:uncharacterized protein DUF6174
VPGSENVAMERGLSGVFEDTVGANSPAPPPGSRTFNLRTPGQLDSLHAEITRQSELWRAGGARDYAFLLRSSCFCPGQQGWIRLEVRDGQAVRGWDARANPVRLTEPGTYSLGALFDVLKQVADRVDVVEVSFDNGWHYPAYIRTDVRLGLPDDWGILQVRGFRPH